MYKEFSFPQLQNKYLLIKAIGPLFLTNRWLERMKVWVIVRVACVYVQRESRREPAVKHKNGRLSLNTMTSFLSLAARVARAGKLGKRECPFGTD